MSKNIFNRTVKTNIILYPTDGMGRDGYITYNNAGFWKENYKQVVPKEKFERKPYAIFRSWRKIPPSWNYHSDGSGRDLYILCNYGGLIKKYSSNFNKNDYLRNNDFEHYQPQPKYDFLSKAEKQYQHQLNKIQKDLITRLYENCKNKGRILRKDNSATELLNKKKYNLFNKINNKTGYNNYNCARSLSQFRSNQSLPDIMNQNQCNGNLYGSMDKTTDIRKRKNFAKYRVKCLSNSVDDKCYGDSGNFNYYNLKKNASEKNMLNEY